MTETENDSLYLAMEYVRSVLRSETFAVGLAFGDEISVTKLDDYDCIPVSIYCDNGWHRSDSPRGTWSMVLASIVPRTDSRQRTAGVLLSEGPEHETT